MKELIEKYQKVPVIEYNNKVNSEPLVSVCVQTYNHINYIEDCLDGILMQKTNFPIEILLGEDESNDGTRKICIDYAEKYPDKIRLFLHSRENNIKINGQPTGRFNLLYNLFKARGKYIALCEGDDYWTDPHKLQKQVDFLESNPKYSLCAHEPQIIFEDVPVKENFYKKPDDGDFGFSFEDEFDNHFIPTASVLFRSEFVKTLPDCFKNCISGDIALFLYLLSKGSGYYFESRMAVKRRNPGGITFSPERKNRLFEGMYQLWLCVNTFTPLQVKGKMTSRLADYERAMARRKLKQMNPLFVVYLLKSFLKKPQWFMSLRYFRNTP